HRNTNAQTTNPAPTRLSSERIPYQIIKELHPKDFAKIRQPKSKKGINDLDNAIGFHFSLQPEVEAVFEDDKIIIKNFISNFRERSEEHTSELQSREKLVGRLV